ncbi:aspartate aminotransferase family protein [Cellulomonas bogoriensis]|uniref:4-aminobutyrate aminotransferase n=1 Tax=Cellulomonas bogoriensis 69B4 = DSM 16987 TaxID=1386082 RepID=A0A0A0BZE9_9CELL|nr:aspartate aminotransferase family protein [Cellulomonas bogoriensis]KGM13743.1 4-aminobutyrate aminotransferase [Cellulomonas bogoriensis 69B4 = DSM 16987]
MATRSTIMDTNSFRPEVAHHLSPATRALTERRKILGPAYRLFYRDPIHLVRGQGAHLYDADGAEYLDVYNNVASVGHANPRVVEAVTRQMSTLNTHTRYLHEAVLDYSADLLSTMPAELDRLMLLCTGSEANDLAVRVAQVATGRQGIIISAEAYHGNTALVSQLSPALGTAQGLAPWVRLVPEPDPRRIGGEELGAWFARQVAAQIADLEAAGHGVAALLVDSIFSSDGVFPDPAGFLAPAVDLVHDAGGVVISDEVQPGFGRTGAEFWGFARHGVVPDLVTTGKPMGNGIPVSGLAARHETLAPFAENLPYFNTFGGNPVSVAAAQAVLDVIREDGLQLRADRVGSALLADLRALGAGDDRIGQVRGSGLYLGLEIVDPDDGAPSRTLALDLVEELRARRVLTSVCGGGGNVLKLRPPLVFDDVDAARLLEELTAALAVLR